MLCDKTKKLFQLLYFFVFNNDMSTNETYLIRMLASMIAK